MPKFIKKPSIDWGDMGRTAVGLGMIGIGSAIGQEIGSIISGYVAQRWVCKSSFTKQFVMAIALLNAVDLLFERFIPRGVM